MKIRRAGSSRGARVFSATAPWAALAILALTLATLAGCGKGAVKATEPVYPYVAEGPRTFYASAAGLVDTPPPAASDPPAIPPAIPPATRAPNASILSSNGEAFLVAVNGWGLVRVERGAASNGPASDGAIRYRLEGKPLPGLFEGLTTAGAWPVSGGFLMQLFRDPFTEALLKGTVANPTGAAAGGIKAATATTAASGGSASGGSAPGGSASGATQGGRLVFLPSSGEAFALEPFAQACAGGYELFALLPSEKGWFAELRKETASRVELKFLSLDDPLADSASGVKADGADGDLKAGGASKAVEVGRARFEEALMPRAFASLGGADAGLLAAALRALGDGPWLVRLRSAAGRDAWYLSGGKAEEATPAYAWSGPEGMLALRSDGWLAITTAGSGTRIASLGEPVPGAAFTAVAAARGLVAAAWEAGEFPGIAAAGAVIAPLPR